MAYLKRVFLITLGIVLGYYFLAQPLRRAISEILAWIERL